MASGGRPQHGRAEPVGGLQREFHVLAVIADRPAEALLRLPDPVLNRVLVQYQLFSGRLVAAPVLQEDQQGVAQPGVVLIVSGQATQRAEHPGPQEFRSSGISRRITS